jgi:RNA polymerase sigma factor (TIGR02999 family)
MRKSESVGEVTELLAKWKQGSVEAENEIFHLVNGDLRRLARYAIRDERNCSLQATELVDQIYVRLVSAKDRGFHNRQHFFAIAARSMRRHLIDLARTRSKAEITGIEKADEKRFAEDGSKINLALTIDSLLIELTKDHPDWCRVVEMKYFLGLTTEEVADVMGVGVRTVQRMWCDARQWLFDRLESAKSRAI